MDGLGFEDVMLAKYGCGTVEAVAGRSRPAKVLAVVLNDGFHLSPRAFASLLVSWFGGHNNGYRVLPRQSDTFLFQVAHECIAKEIVLREPWRSGILFVKMSLYGSPLSVCRVAAAGHAHPDARFRVWMANASLPSLLGPWSTRAQVLGCEGNHLIASDPRA